MSIQLAPDLVVRAQLDAYPGVLLASGDAEIRSRMVERVKTPNLHVRLLRRTLMTAAAGATVIDHETITRSFPERPGEIDMSAICEVAGELIRSGLFIVGESRLDAPSGQQA